MKKPAQTQTFAIGDLVRALDQKAPFDYAEEWDNVGFLAGDADERLRGAVVAVNLGPEALSAAAQNDANVIICHHPPLFKPLKHLTRSAHPYLYEAVRKGLGIIALHSNFDLASEELNQTLAKKLGFQMSSFLAPRASKGLPPSLRQEAARQAHPYEEIAYDVLGLSLPRKSLGYGFVGTRATRRDKSVSFTFPKFLDGVKQTFQLSSVTVAGPGLTAGSIKRGMKIQKIAFSPGSGSSFVSVAAAKGVDAYICGEVGYHHMLEARAKGLTLVILGHSYSERFFVETVAGWCDALTPTLKIFETVHANV